MNSFFALYFTSSFLRLDQWIPLKCSSWLTWTPNKNICFTWRVVLVLQCFPWQLAPGWKPFPRTLISFAILCEYLMRTLYFFAQAPPIPALNFLILHGPQHFLLRWFNPMSFLWGHSSQSLCCPSFATSWPLFLPLFIPNLGWEIWVLNKAGYP